MLLSQGCQYALRAVLYVAQHEHAPLLSKDIASRLDMPPHFLAKILHDLSKHGLLVSYKGRGGGFRLARPAAEITLAQRAQSTPVPAAPGLVETGRVRRCRAGSGASRPAVRRPATDC